MKDQKLWNNNFQWICESNFWIYNALYALLIGLPLMLEQTSNLNRQTLFIATLCFIVGIWLPGIFSAYLMDRFRRKTIYLIALLGCALTTILIPYHPEWLVLLRLIQGACFGLTLNLGNTLTVDISASPNRGAAINAYARTGRIGAWIGVVAAWALFQFMGKEGIYYFALACNVLAFCCICRVSVTFRAELKIDKISLDRFFLPHKWASSIIVLFLAITSGLLILNTFFIAKQYFPLSPSMQLAPWCTFIMGAVITFCIHHFFFKNKTTFYPILLGIALLIIGCTILCYDKDATSFILIFALIGGGIEHAATELLCLFTKIGQHSQRGTASYSFLLSWETGLILGSCIAFFQKESFEIALYTSLITAILYLLFAASRKT